MSRRWFPHSLRPKDAVALLAPSSDGKPELTQGAVKYLESEGLRTKVYPSVSAKWSMYAGTEEARVADLMSAVEDPEIKMILCVRGGYGAFRLTGMIDWRKVVRARKLLCGFSDITALHCAIQSAGGISLYGPNGETFARPRADWTLESFHNAIFGGDPLTPRSPAGTMLVPGKASGILTGGCLTLLSDSMGTPWATDCRGKIVLIEDINERPHRIDAMMTNLLNAGNLAKAKGVVVGVMRGTDEKRDAPEDPTWIEIFKDRVGGLGIPVITGYPFGHVAEMVTLPLGARVQMDAESGRLKMLERHTLAAGA
jgi:muramoyltetrapeptide carboxypeptidase